MAITFYPFGTLRDGTEVTAARLENRCGASAVILDYGATLQSLLIPDRAGQCVDVVLGYDTAAEYEASNGHLGATIGRVGDRNGGAVFSLNGKTYPLAKNNGENHLHGGLRGFDRRMWQMTESGGSLVCERLSPDGEEGYPGSLRVRVSFSLTDDNALHILYEADTDQDTLVNLTNHSYFNLNGGGSVLGHWLQVNAERFCENDEHCLPTGRLLSVEGTPFDFRTGKEIGADIGMDDEQLRRGNGYDHNYVLAGTTAAKLYSAGSGLTMTVTTDLPGMQLYTANSLSERAGKQGSAMAPRDAACFETQLFPNAMNCYGFPSPVLHSGEHLRSETVYSFQTDADPL